MISTIHTDVHQEMCTRILAVHDVHDDANYHIQNALPLHLDWEGDSNKATGTEGWREGHESSRLCDGEQL